jgi:signal transduction histidine kinase
MVKVSGRPSEKELVPKTTTGRTDGILGALSPRTSERPSKALHPAVRYAVDAAMREERGRWAMQIHDGLTQSVTSAVLEIQTLRHRIEQAPDDAIASLGAVEEELRKDLGRIRDLLFEMTEDMPSTAEPALSAIVREARERWHLETTLDVRGDTERLDEALLDGACAIVSEALANAAKHSGAAVAHVRVYVERDEVRVEVEDVGRGIFAVDDGSRHFGLQLMRTRAESLGGTLDIGSIPGRGTTVVAVLPVGGRGEER